MSKAPVKPGLKEREKTLQRRANEQRQKLDSNK